VREEALRETIAVTGLGMTTCLGIGVEANWRQLRNGQTGLRPVSRFEVGDSPVREGGEAPPPAAGPTAEEELSFEIRHLLGVVREACRQAGFAGGLPQDREVGVVVGSSLAGSSSADRFFKAFREKGPREVDYGLLRGYYLEEELGALCGALGAAGPAVLVSNACAAGGSSLAQGARWLRGGRADLVIAAGYDPLSIFTFAGFGSLMALSTSKLRPFSRNRDGMLLGDGFAAVVLEPGSRARAEGRSVLAEFTGCGESTDAHHLTHPHPRGEGAALAMRRALEMGSLQPADIDYVNCHGTGTRPNDRSESWALREVFGDRLAGIPVSSSKPFFGHTLGGAGTVEAVVTILSALHGFLPANLNLDEVDPEFADLNLVSEGRPADVRHAMSNNFGFGGSNASLIFSRPGEERT
jgi:3-oxoacyl-[acyl-carrier-protein] synthase II